MSEGVKGKEQSKALPRPVLGERVAVRGNKGVKGGTGEAW